jgi:hypothetical protein
VVMIGSAHLVDDKDEKMQALQLITDHVVPGRWGEVRWPNALELKQTSVLALPLAEVSAKIRRGPPLDDDVDYALPIWAGVVPVCTRLGTPVDDGRVPVDVPAVDVARITRFATPAG